MFLASLEDKAVNCASTHVYPLLCKHLHFSKRVDRFLNYRISLLSLVSSRNYHLIVRFSSTNYSYVYTTPYKYVCRARCSDCIRSTPQLTLTFVAAVNRSTRIQYCRLKQASQREGRTSDIGSTQHDARHSLHTIAPSKTRSTTQPLVHLINPKRSHSTNTRRPIHQSNIMPNHTYHYTCGHTYEIKGRECYCFYAAMMGINDPRNHDRRSHARLEGYRGFVPFPYNGCRHDQTHRHDRECANCRYWRAEREKECLRLDLERRRETEEGLEGMRRFGGGGGGGGGGMYHDSRRHGSWFYGRLRR